MNWRHGLLRIWIVLSAIWLATSIWYLDPISHFRMLHRTIILKYDENSFEFPSGFPLTEIKKSPVDWAETRQAEIARLPKRGSLLLTKLLTMGCNRKGSRTRLLVIINPSISIFAFFVDGAERK